MMLELQRYASELDFKFVTIFAITKIRRCTEYGQKDVGGGQQAMGVHYVNWP